MKVTQAVHTGITYVGVDVAKDSLSIDAGAAGAVSVANARADIRRALGGIARKAGGPLHVCCEATGPYTRELAEACRAAGLAFSVLNPAMVRHFAKSLGLAKTDPLDAGVTRRYAQVRPPAPSAGTRGPLAAMRGLVTAREATVRCLTALRAALGSLEGCPAAAKRMRRDIAALEKGVAGYDRLIAQAAGADEQTGGLVTALSTVKGVGRLTAAKIACLMPEIGTLGRRKAAKLAGLAPCTWESGAYKGRARIGGGRKRVRDALYMCALVASHHCPVMTRYYRHDIGRGKTHRQAVTAVMRRLICRLDAVAKAYYAARGAPPEAPRGTREPAA